MKKLNKKGFTLVELLAVIVILAVIMVITIPTVMSSMSGAKQGAIDSAAKAIESYVEKQYELCTFGNDKLTTTDYQKVFSRSGTTCSLLTDADLGKDVATATGYSEELDYIYIVPVTGATGQFTVHVQGKANGEFGSITSTGYPASTTGLAGGKTS